MARADFRAAPPPTPPAQYCRASIEALSHHSDTFRHGRHKWSKLAKALGDADVIEEDAFEALSGLVSLPFPRLEWLGKGETWRVEGKVIDPRGNEGMRECRY